MDVGEMVGWLDGGSLTYCSVSGSVDAGVNGMYTGGLVGYSSGAISNCSASGTVNGNYAVGGLVGEGWGHVSSCLVLNQEIQTQGKLVHCISGYPAVLSGEKIYAWDGMKVSGPTVPDSDANGSNVSSSKLWTTLNF